MHFYEYQESAMVTSMQLSGLKNLTKPLRSLPEFKRGTFSFKYRCSGQVALIGALSAS
jgi:hypothetical protein